MRKRSLSNFLIICMVLTLLPVPVQAEETVERNETQTESNIILSEVTSGTCGENLTWELDTETGILTISGTGDMYNSYYSQAPWGSNNLDIKQVDIGYGATNIGDWAFLDCVNLTSITIPNSVTEISDYAFWNCSSLNSITIPGSVTKITGCAFWNCSSLTDISVDINSNYYTSVDGVLCNKDITTVLGYPPGKTDTSYVIPNSAIEIDEYAFETCNNLVSVTVSDSVVKIGNSAFWRCGNLTSVTIPSSVTEIKNLAFGDCSSLTDIYYTGNKAQWDAITIGIGNESLFEATIYYNSNQPDTPTSDPDELTWTLEDGVLTISGSNIPIPDYRYSNNPWYDIRQEILSVVIQKGITSIGNSAFLDCGNLTSVTIPDSVTRIGNKAFQNCGELTSITIPDSIISIGQFAFKDCCRLTEVAIPNSITSIGQSVFEHCSDLRKVTIPDNVTVIGQSAFQYCDGLMRITIPDSVVSIGQSAFKGCYDLIRVTIPDSVSFIGNEAFSDCQKLINIDVDTKNSEYSSIDGVLYNKDKTTIICYPGGKTGRFNIPDSVTSIGDYAFSGCSSNLISIIIPSSITEIGDYAFRFCYNLTSITIPDSITRIGDYAFSGCSSLTDIYYTGTENQWDAIIGDTWKNDYIRNATIHYNSESNSVLSGTCGDNLIWKLDIQTGILTISGTGEMKKYGYPPLSPWCENLSIKQVTIEQGVTSIGSCAFMGCKNLSSIIIPNSVTYIDGGAFKDCSSLTSVTIPDSIISISNYEFSNCTSLTRIDVDRNNSVYSSQDGVLMNKEQTTIICYPAGKTGTSYVIPNSVTSVNTYAFRSCTNLTSVTIPSSVTSIDRQAFTSSTSLVEFNVDHNNGVYSSVDGILMNKNQTEIVCYPAGRPNISYTTPNNVTSIGHYAFEGCIKLTNLVISDSVTRVGISAFISCINLENITIPDSVVLFGTSSPSGFGGQVSSVFRNCPKLLTAGPIGGDYNIKFGWSQTILLYAFYDCSSLTSVTIPSSITSIEHAAFSDCINLTDIYYTGTKNQWDKITIDRSRNDFLLNATIHYAIDVPDTCTVQFDANTEMASPSSITVEKGKTLSSLPVLTRDGYIFEGWYTAQAGGTQFTANTPVTNNIILYAHWSEILPKTFVITWNASANGGKINGRDSITTDVTEGDTTIAPSDTPEKTGYSFTDWYTSASGGKLYNTVSITDDQTFYAQFTANQYTITWNKNGGSGSDFASQQTYGMSLVLPSVIPSRADYTFDGWFTSATGGSQVTVSTTYDMAYNTTYYAHWTFNPSSYTVIFDANGGTVALSSKTVTNGQSYGELPTPMLAENKFDGWYTARNGGTQVISSTTVSLTEDQTLYAHWTANPSTYTVTFNANGGSVTPASKTVTNRQTYGNLPIPTLSGSDFSGWYTAQTGGTRVTASTTVNLTGNQTLYAHWIQRAQQEFVWGQDNWNFNNNSYQGGFNSGIVRDQINAHYLDMLEKNLTNDEYELVFRGIPEFGIKSWLDNTWRGSCYGMSALCLLSKQGLLPYSLYQPGATNLYQLNSPKADMEISSLVTYYQLLQAKSVIQNQYFIVPYVYTHQQNIENIIALLNKNNTVLIGFASANLGGHTVLAYGYEYGNYDWDGVTYQGRVKICDPNSSTAQNDKCDIYFNTTSYNWIIPYYNDSAGGSVGSIYGANFNYIGADVDEINDGGYLMENNQDTTDFVARIDVISASPNHSIVEVVESNGNYYTQNNSSTDIVKAYSYIANGGSEGKAGYNLFYPGDSYRISQTNPVKLQLSMNYENCLLRAGSFAGKSVIFDKKGYVSVASESAHFDIGMTFNENYPTDWFTIQVSGENVNNVSLEMCQDGYLISGDNLERIVVKANNRTNSVQTNFSTEYSSVLIYEVDADSIGAKVDTDNDGIYETLITPKHDSSVTELPVELESVTNNKATLIFSNNLPGTCCVAIYNTVGRMLAVGAAQVSTNAGKVSISYNSIALPSARTIKVFMLDDKMIPIYKAKTFS